MKILVILGHPDPKSLNHAIADAIREDLTNAGHPQRWRSTADGLGNRPCYADPCLTGKQHNRKKTGTTQF